MTITVTQSIVPMGTSKRVTGSYTDDAASPAAAVLALGFAPTYFLWLNATDRISYEWFLGMADGTSLKTVAAGTRTLDTADTAFTSDPLTPTDLHAGFSQGNFGPPNAANPGTPTTQYEIWNSPPGDQGGKNWTVNVGGSNSLILQNKVNYWVAIG